jgi:glycosyltransferase involved in cell wall biosynthesis
MNTEIGGVVSVVEGIIKSDSTVEHVILSLSKSHSDYRHNGKPYFYEINYQFDPSYTAWSYLRTALFKKHTEQKCDEVIKLVKQINPNVLHFHTNLKELIIGKILKQHLPDVLLMVTEHLVRLDEKSNMNVVSKKILAMAFSMFFKGYEVVAVSPSVQNYLLKYNLVDPEKLTLIENTINVNEFKPIDFPEKEILNLIYLARINFVKNHYELLQALKLLKNGNYKLFIAGPDETNGSVKKLATDLGLIDKVDFMGPVTKIPEILRKMDIAVFPSTKEGLPVSLLEKMSAGLPMVVSNIPELTSIIKDGENGLVYKLGSPEELANKITKLMDDKKLREHLGKEARNYVEMRYNIPLAKRYDEFYLKML